MSPPRLADIFNKLGLRTASQADSLKDSSNAWKKSGDACLRENRLPEAEAFYRRALSQWSEFGDAHIALGFALMKMARLDEAEAHLQRARSIDPGSVDAHYLLGMVAKRQRDQQSAVAHYRRALEIDPRFEAAYRDLYDMLKATGDIPRAKAVIEAALSFFPESAEFHCYRADLCSQEGHQQEAVDFYRKSLALDPEALASHINLGTVLSELGRHQEAIDVYRRALAIDAASTDAHAGLGNAAQSAGDLDLAIACHEQVVRLKPNDAPAQVRLGDLLLLRGKIDDAIERYREALLGDNEHIPAHLSLGNAYWKAGRQKESLDCFERILRLDPGNPVRHLVAAFSGLTTDSAPPEYVERLFDEYAETFDSHLVQSLRYNVPANLMARIRAGCHLEPRAMSILDLGCGTGLFGVEASPFARQLIGVDLSAKMLAKAQQRNLYQRLEQMDLVAMMRGEPSESYDLAAASDVFVYLGVLDDVVAEARRLLSPNGIFAFSVESLESSCPPGGNAGANFALGRTGRYAHSIEYLRLLAESNGFDAITTVETTLRIDMGVAVIGYLSVWIKSAPTAAPVTIQGLFTQ